MTCCSWERAQLISDGHEHDQTTHQCAIGLLQGCSQRRVGLPSVDIATYIFTGIAPPRINQTARTHTPLSGGLWARRALAVHAHLPKHGASENKERGVRRVALRDSLVRSPSSRSVARSTIRKRRRAASTSLIFYHNSNLFTATAVAASKGVGPGVRPGSSSPASIGAPVSALVLFWSPFMTASSAKVPVCSSLSA